jgi:hypothetical protein
LKIISYILCMRRWLILVRLKTNGVCWRRLCIEGVEGVNYEDAIETVNRLLLERHGDSLKIKDNMTRIRKKKR